MRLCLLVKITKYVILSCNKYLPGCFSKIQQNIEMLYFDLLSLNYLFYFRIKLTLQKLNE